MKKFIGYIVVISMLFFACARKSNNGSGKINSNNIASLANTPPMGWNSYNCFGGNVTEAEVKANADYMAQNLKSFGWEYIVVDFLWYCDDMYNRENFKKRIPVQHIDKNGRLIPSEVLFPSSKDGQGFKPLADYVHGKGLKFGIHIMRGIPLQAITQNTPVLNSDYKAAKIANVHDTCAWYAGLVGLDMTQPGAQEYYNSLFELYAEWGVDFVKADDISFPYHANEIEAIRNAMDRCGRPMVLSLSPGPAPIGNVKHLRENANMWRISADFWDKWDRLKEQVRLCRHWAPYVTEGHWPDADMLPLGKLNKRTELVGHPERFTNFTKNEQHFLMTLWAVFRSPLFFGGNLPENDAFTLSLLTNKDVIRLNQNSKNNREISYSDGVSIWGADDKTENIKYLAVLNTNDSEKTVLLPVNAQEVKNGQLKDLWNNVPVQSGAKGFEVVVPAHGAGLVSYLVK